jgi:hypothetical protein
MVPRMHIQIKNAIYPAYLLDSGGFAFEGPERKADELLSFLTANPSSLVLKE